MDDSKLSSGDVPVRRRALGGRRACVSSWRRSTAPSRAACSRRWSACSATSTSPRRRCTTPFAPRSSNGRARACPPTRAPGWYRRAASRRSTPSAGARASTSLDDVAEQPDRGERGRAGPSDEHRGRPPAADLHLLPSGAVARRAGRADAARSVRPHHRGDRARLPHRRAHARAAHRARQGQDPRRAHPLRSARPAELPARLDSVLRVIYLVFNEGYSASSGDLLTRPICPARRSGSAGCWSSCCPSPRRSGCWR